MSEKQNNTSITEKMKSAKVNRSAVVAAVLLVAALFVYDVFMTSMVRVYFARIRNRIRSLLK